MHTRSCDMHKFGVEDVNNNGWRLLDMCRDTNIVCLLEMCNSSLNNICRTCENMNVINVIITKVYCMLRWVSNDVKVVRELSGGLSDHMIVLCMIRLVQS